MGALLWFGLGRGVFGFGVFFLFGLGWVFFVCFLSFSLVFLQDQAGSVSPSSERDS